MPKQVSIWAPIFKGDPEPTMSLAVQANYVPTQNQYRGLLQDHLDKEILADPVKAKEQMRAMGETSSQPNPELSAIPVGSQPQQWAAQILQLDQMGMLLSQIDWQKDNPPRELSDENLPSLMDVLEML
jgi:hypothetical protein